MDIVNWLRAVARSLALEIVGPREPLMQRQNRPSDPDQWPSEDDAQRERLGPRGVPGEPDPARMTPERKKKTPTDKGGAPEHTA